MKVNHIFVPPDTNAGPRKLCDICKVYFTFDRLNNYRCPSCGSKGDIIESTTKVLHAIGNAPIIKQKKAPKAKYDEDLPHGANWIYDETYNPA